MIHRFAAVPVLSIYYRYGWPTFLSLSALTAFSLVRPLASRGTALFAAVLILVGGDFSYLAAWFLPHATYQWDYVLWPTIFSHRRWKCCTSARGVRRCRSLAPI
jgi:hypothetical protein